MLIISNTGFVQNAVTSGTGYAGWLYHINHLTIGGNFEPKSTLHLHHETNPAGPVDAPTLILQTKFMVHIL